MSYFEKMMKEHEKKTTKTRKPTAKRSAKKKGGVYPMAGAYPMGGADFTALMHGIGNHLEDLHTRVCHLEGTDPDGGNFFDDLWSGIKDAVSTVGNVVSHVADIAPVVAHIADAVGGSVEDLHRRVSALEHGKHPKERVTRGFKRADEVPAKFDDAMYEQKMGRQFIRENQSPFFNKY